MIKNIVFDLGGVVVKYSPKIFLEKRFANLEIEHFIYDTIFGSEEWRALDKGTITRNEANAIFLNKAKQVGRVFEVQSVLDEWLDIMTPKNDTISLIRRLKMNGYNVYYLSNIPKDVLEIFNNDYNFLPLFTGGVASCNVNMLKPEKDIYKYLLNTYSLYPQETVFCDDSLNNVAAAQQLGINAFQFTQADSFEKKLNELGVNTKRPQVKK